MDGFIFKDFIEIVFAIIIFGLLIAVLATVIGNKINKQLERIYDDEYRKRHGNVLQHKHYNL